MDIVATEAISSAGALVYWRMDGFLDPEELGALWAEEGLEAAWLPSTPGPTTALARALREVAGRRQMVRPLDKRGAFAIVLESAKEEDLTHAVDLKVKLDAVGRVVFEPPVHKLAAGIRADYELHLAQCSSEDVGTWLCGIVRRLQAVALRDTGGFYFIPPHQLEVWRKITRAVSGVSAHKLFAIPAMRSADAVKAILDAIEQEAEAEAAGLEADIEAGKLKERGFMTRVAHCESVETKLAMYEGLLGGKLDTIRERLENVRAQLTSAILSTPES